MTQPAAPNANVSAGDALGGGGTLAGPDRIDLPAMSDAEVVGHFESLGDNCEFGAFQRKLGLEPLGLLRWAGIPLPSLLHAFMDDLDAGPDMQTSLEVEGLRREYMLKVDPLGWRGHTFISEGEHPADRVLKEQTIKFRYLAAKMIEDLEQGSKILVFRCNEPIVDDSIFALHDAINWYGPNTLLWVVEADEGNDPGSVSWLRPGLMKGYVSRLSVRSNPALVTPSTWKILCRNAYKLWRDSERPCVTPWSESRLLERIKFGTDGNAAPFCTAGWGRQEKGFAWGVADASGLSLPRPASCAAYALKLLVKPFRPDGVLRQRLSVLVNGEHVKTFSAVPHGMVMCHIPAAVIADRQRLDVTFACPGGLSPKDARIGSDTRKLTVEFREARLYGLHPQ